jgi:hypothetical protein
VLSSFDIEHNLAAAYRHPFSLLEGRVDDDDDDDEEDDDEVVR